MMMENPYNSIEAVIEDIITETPTIKTFRFKPIGNFSFKTGQFVEITVPGLGEAPFTPSSDPKINDLMEVTIMSVGRTTRALHSMKKGDTVRIRGPYGKGYPLQEFQGKDILIVGGGVGLAPLRSLLYTLFNDSIGYNKIFLRYGARTPKDMVYKNQMQEWAKKPKMDLVATVDTGDEDWKGKVGLVTTILENLKIGLSNSISVVCGPPIMMKFVTLKLLDTGHHPKNIYLSMEKNMNCGFGKCGHCRIGTFYACKDGPVFTYEAIKNFPEVWD